MFLPLKHFMSDIKHIDNTLINCAYKVMSYRREKNIAHLRNISIFLKKDNIDYLVIRGVPQEKVLYNKTNYRDIGDIDLIVKEEHSCNKAKWTLKNEEPHSII